MTDNKELLPISPYPSNVVPINAKPIFGIDFADGADCTVRGFYDQSTREYHIQEVIYNTRPDQEKK